MGEKSPRQCRHKEPLSSQSNIADRTRNLTPPHSLLRHASTPILHAPPTPPPPGMPLVALPMPLHVQPPPAQLSLPLLLHDPGSFPFPLTWLSLLIPPYVALPPPHFTLSCLPLPVYPLPPPPPPHPQSWLTDEFDGVSAGHGGIHDGESTNPD